jgi:hypothetical protein
MLFSKLETSAVSRNDRENIYSEWMDREIRNFLSNVVPMAEEMWDVQERDGRCEVKTG